MPPKIEKYYLVDPVGRTNSGISSYVESASCNIRELGIAVEVIRKSNDEDIEGFRKRVGDYRKNCNIIYSFRLNRVLR